MSGIKISYGLLATVFLALSWFPWVHSSTALNTSRQDTLKRPTVGASVVIFCAGKPVFAQQPGTATLVEITVDLLSSCTDREKRHFTDEDWLSLPDSGKTLYIGFGEPRRIEAAGRAVLVEEIMVPIDSHPLQGKILVREGGALISPFITCNQDILDALLEKALTEAGQ